MQGIARGGVVSGASIASPGLLAGFSREVSSRVFVQAFDLLYHSHISNSCQ